MALKFTRTDLNVAEPDNPGPEAVAKVVHAHLGRLCNGQLPKKQKLLKCYIIQDSPDRGESLQRLSRGRALARIVLEPRHGEITEY